MVFYVIWWYVFFVIVLWCLILLCIFCLFLIVVAIRSCSSPQRFRGHVHFFINKREIWYSYSKSVIQAFSTTVPSSEKLCRFPWKPQFVKIHEISLFVPVYQQILSFHDDVSGTNLFTVYGVFYHMPFTKNTMLEVMKALHPIDRRQIGWLLNLI